MRSYIKGWVSNGMDYFAISLESNAYDLGRQSRVAPKSALFRRRSDCPKAEIARLTRPKAFYFHGPTLDAGLAGAIDERADHAVLRAMMPGNLHAFALALR